MAGSDMRMVMSEQRRARNRCQHVSRLADAEAAAKNWTISGVTRDTNGAVLGGCTVELYTTTDGVLRATTTSDPATGAYSFFVNTAGQYQATAYLPGSPDRAGQTVNTLVGI